MKVYDCFPFFNELELLEIRLELLYDKVDYFVVSECDHTFSGLPKRFIFEDNKSRFSKYIDKIIHIKNFDTKEYLNPKNEHRGKKFTIYQSIVERLRSIVNTPQTDFGAPHWCRDFLHKELSMLGLSECDSNDLIMFGDVDEIPNPKKLIFDGNSYLFKQIYLMYFLNNENLSQEWQGTYLTKFSNLIEDSCMFTRDKRNSFQTIEDGGWHLSFVGDSERIKEKIKSWSHQEFNHPSILEGVSDRISNFQDVFNRNLFFRKRELNDIFPTEIVNMINKKYKHLIRE